MTIHDRDHGIDAYLDQRADDLARGRTALDDDTRRSFLADLVEPFGRPTATELDRGEPVPCDGYDRRRVTFEALPGVRFGAHLLTPDGWPGGGPLVIAVHGHGYGSGSMVGLDRDGRPLDDARVPHPVQLARAGIRTIVPDVVGFGDRMTDRDAGYDAEVSSSCYRIGTRMLQQGLTVSGLRVAELLALVDLFAGRDDVGRIGITGYSGGAMWAMITSALDDRIDATLLGSYPNTHRRSIEAVRHCVCNYLPGVAAVADQPDLAALIAPRALFAESGRRDPIFPPDGFATWVEQVGRRYVDLPAGRFDHHLHDGAHEISGERSVPWLIGRLLDTEG